MQLLAQQPIPNIFFGIIAFVLLGFLASWFFLAERMRAGKPVLPRYEPRRPVPWTGLDLLMVVIFFLCFSFIIQGSVLLVGEIGGKPKAEKQQRAAHMAAPIKQERKETTAHPLAQLLKDKDPKILLLCFLFGVVIAPIFEEFIFRLLFTGWLMSVERRFRKRWPAYFRSRGVLPILIPAAVFAALHFRVESREIPETNLVLSMSIQAAVSLLTLICAIIWITERHGIAARDLGWDKRKWREDMAAGAVAFFATALPIYVLQIVLGWVLPEEFAPIPSRYFSLPSFWRALCSNQPPSPLDRDAHAAECRQLGIGMGDDVISSSNYPWRN